MKKNIYLHEKNRHKLLRRLLTMHNRSRNNDKINDSRCSVVTENILF